MVKRAKFLYEIALENFPEDLEVWAEYIKLLIKNDYISTAETKLESIRSPSMKSDIIQKSFQEIYYNLPPKKITDRFYLLYTQLLVDQYKNLDQETKKSEREKVLEFILQVFEKAVLFYALKQPIWISYLKFLLEEKLEESNEVFDRALFLFPDDSFPFWRLMIFYKQLLGDSNDVMNLYKKAIGGNSPAVSQFFKPILVEYTANFLGIAKAREVYSSLMNSKPCLNLHYQMANLEKIMGVGNAEQVRKCYENAVKFFGATDPKVWVTYILYEKNIGADTEVLIKRAFMELGKEYQTKFQTILDKNGLDWKFKSERKWVGGIDNVWDSSTLYFWNFGQISRILEIF